LVVDLPAISGFCVRASDRSIREDSSPPEAGTAVGDGHQSLIREVNQRIEQLNGEWEQDGPTIVLCECAQADCLEKIEISMDAYERVRRSATRFLVKPDHVATEGERVVEETDGYAVVEKLGRARVLVVDDSDAFLRAAASLVSAGTEVGLVGVAGSGEEAIGLLADLKPDLVLLDVKMPGLNGVETARIIRSQSPTTVVVLVSADPSFLEDTAHSAGAAALLDKAELGPGTLDALWLKHRTGLVVGNVSR
jgi:CheY-like chemotaxis protein